MRPTPFLKKLFMTIFSALTSIALLLVIGNSGTIKWLPPMLIFGLCFIILLASLIFPFYWKIKERNDQINTRKVEEILNKIIIYTLAINIATFGWKKF